MRIRRNSPFIALCGLVLMLAVSNALLIRQNLQMRAVLSKAKPDYLRPGDKVPAFSAVDLRADPMPVNYSGTEPKRVLLFFTPTCPYCREQFAYWRALIAHTDKRRFEILGVVRDRVEKAKVADYLRSIQCSSDTATPLPVVFIPDPVRRNYKLSATPITLVVANDGTIEKAWAGRWEAESLSEANNFFGVNFSNIEPEKEHAALRQ